MFFSRLSHKRDFIIYSSSSIYSAVKSYFYFMSPIVSLFTCICKKKRLKYITIYTWMKTYFICLLFEQKKKKKKKKKMFEKMLSFVCCCLPTLTTITASSSTKHKRHKRKTAFIISCRKLRMRKRKKNASTFCMKIRKKNIELNLYA